MTSACTIRVRGVVQGVGFRPFVYRLARANTLAGWVLNGDEGVEIHLEGDRERVDAFLRELRAEAPAAASITAIDVDAAEPSGLDEFVIRASRRPRPAHGGHLGGPGGVRALSSRALRSGRSALPLSRTSTAPTAARATRSSCGCPTTARRPRWARGRWTRAARGEYHDPGSRRFHAQPVACPACGPASTRCPARTTGTTRRSPGDEAAIARAAALLRGGAILAIKGLGGYHLACDARNPAAVAALRDRKFRKEKPFALMARDLAAARALVELTPEAEALLASPAAPIVLAPGRVTCPTSPPRPTSSA